MHKEYILLNGFRKAKKGFTAGFHVPLMSCEFGSESKYSSVSLEISFLSLCQSADLYLNTL